ncbi:MAG: CoA transferase [Deltaproteobacteria bacterium]|nr:MAG: CoA transferase [Deltaproteobacteria bacterium]
MPGALDGLRVLEIGDLVSAAYATKLLADLGADVVKVEARRGDLARGRGPFPRNTPHPDASGLFLYLNANKRGITLDLTHPRGQAALEALAGRTDLLVHNVHPTLMAAHGLDYERLAAANPRLVMTSIAPFGLSGPHASYRGPDVVTWSAGGVSTLNGLPGLPDLPPLKACGDQSGFQAALNAAVGSLGALFARLASGRGEHVEVSAQESVAAILELTFEFWPYTGLVASRLGRKPIQPLCFVECRDGWLFLCAVEEHQWQSFVDLMGNPEWGGLEVFANRLARGANFDALEPFLQEWCRDRSVHELYEAAQRRRIPFAPVSTMGDLLASPHLRARGFFATLAHPVAGPVTMPGAPYKLSGTPWQLRTPAPTLGQHTADVLAEAGIDAAALSAAGVV